MLPIATQHAPNKEQQSQYEGQKLPQYTQRVNRNIKKYALGRQSIAAVPFESYLPYK
jgi:hypothetical protein